MWFVGLFAAYITSFYMFRLWYMAFLGKSRAPAHGDAHGHAPHESSWIMLGPLVILALLALTGGWMGWPEALHGSNAFGHFLEPALNTFRDVGNGAMVGTTKVELVTSSRLELGLSGLAMLVAALG